MKRFDAANVFNYCYSVFYFFCIVAALVDGKHKIGTAKRK